MLWTTLMVTKKLSSARTASQRWGDFANLDYADVAKKSKDRANGVVHERPNSCPNRHPCPIHRCPYRPGKPLHHACENL